MFAASEIVPTAAIPLNAPGEKFYKTKALP